jgi:hypothetical protein
MAFETFKNFIGRKKENVVESAEEARSQEDVHEELQDVLGALDRGLASTENIPRNIQSEMRVMLGEGERLRANLKAFLGAGTDSSELRQSKKEAERFLPKAKAMLSSIEQYLPKKEGPKERSL